MTTANEFRDAAADFWGLCGTVAFLDDAARQDAAIKAFGHLYMSLNDEDAAALLGTFEAAMGNYHRRIDRWRLKAVAAR